jgi:hypothetical protein
MEKLDHLDTLLKDVYKLARDVWDSNPVPLANPSNYPISYHKEPWPQGVAEQEAVVHLSGVWLGLEYTIIEQDRILSSGLFGFLSSDNFNSDPS